MSTAVDITGLNKAAVFAALYNTANTLSFLGGDISVNTAQAWMESGDFLGAWEGPNVPIFDYVNGRTLKVNLTGDSFDPWGYDRQYGDGMAAWVITALRAGVTA